MVLKFKKNKYQNRHRFVSWELKIGGQPFTEGREPHREALAIGGKELPWTWKLLSGLARVQLLEQEVWTFPKVSKELWWFS